MSRKDKRKQQVRRSRSKSRPTSWWSKNRRVLVGLGAAIVIVLVVVITRLPATTQTYSAPPPVTIDTSKQYTATIETEKGNLVLDLFADDVPITVNNFVFLAREGFYDGLTFHRVDPVSLSREGALMGTGEVAPVTGSTMKSPSIPTLPVRYQWPTPAPIPTAPSSSSPIPLNPTSMVITRYSAG